MKFTIAAACALALTVPAESISLRFLERVNSQGDIDFKVVSETPFDKESKESKCKCPEDSFWHVKNKECIKKGGQGYECGFFPAENHDDVCKEGLACKKLESSDVGYWHKGAVPASCQPCKDECPKAKPCTSEEITVKGKACAKVEAASKDGPTGKESAIEKATATAKAEATATYGEGPDAVTRTATAEHTATASASDSTKVKGKEPPKASAEACVTVEEAMKSAGVKSASGDKENAEKIMAAGKKLAFEKAKAEAEQGAKKNADAAAEGAERKAEKDAEADAKSEAEAKAKKMAEEGAEKKAKQAAEAAAKEAYSTTAAPKPEPTTTAAPPPAKPAPTEAPGPLFPKAQVPIQPAEEPTVEPRRKIPLDEAAAEMP
mmetsp:Transcript_42131/g.90493  ORF Transcript_42131/g.90493 Transcript_42131/m.90493 type:complete len:377 (+) Transcript_42131:166-1296(+)|eukprot:CAMPEP_0194754310 /NCGR_PEP_ID=MMETSP0323_2-20130528/8256_1 /TAXON_ID=2866 ORGANISM="Crypthecodinium cohnii, Strain Seligo" /NCGR_SAMPLE_ID=MMETSP0323_2 /ASSEMBLY_ACC=CAM_ASM_000346 /LENGTH=376 /DNA_ID=CAMNT_0039672745 /DNA_START=59 /DNA_END=1189 /DNA_ORIENTATION=+